MGLHYIKLDLFDGLYNQLNHLLFEIKEWSLPEFLQKRNTTKFGYKIIEKQQKVRRLQKKKKKIILILL